MAIKKDRTLVIDNWQKGIGESPLTGFGDIVNCDIDNPRGSLKIALAPTKISSSTVTDLLTWLTKDVGVSTNWYGGGGLDNNVYKITSTGTVTSVSGVSGGNKRGGIIWKGYLIAISYDSNNKEFELDAFDLNSTWSNDFERSDVGNTSSNNSFSPTFTHPADSVLYYGSDNVIASLEEKAGQTFDPASSATYTFNASALDLPSNYSAESISQLGTKLVIGASEIGGSYFQQNNFNGLLLPWDRSSASFNNPTSLDRGAVRMISSRNNTLLLANGIRGDFITTNLSLFENVKSIGVLKDNPSSSVGEIYPEASAFVNNEYLFGVSTEDTDFTPAGIYGFRNNAWRRLTISTDEVGKNGDVNIGSISSKGEANFLVGWEDDSTYGIDEFGKSNYRYTGYKAKADSQLFQVGTRDRKKAYTTCEVTLNDNLDTDQGIKVSYRKTLADTWTVLDTTFDYDTHGAVSSASFGANIQDAITLQIRVELTTGTDSTTTPSVKEVRFS